MRVRLLVAAAVAGVLALAGCGGGDGAGGAGGAASAASDASAPSDPSEAPTPAGPAAGTRANLAFSAKTLDGTQFDGATLAGKPAVLWFWAPWCTTCRRQSSDVRTFSAKYAGKVRFVGIAGLDKVPAMRTFVSTTKLGEVTHLADEAGVVWKQFGITQQSTYVVIDASGAIVDSGVYDDEALAERLSKVAGAA
jgi:thiol-disulfide isomerase/thioredoxin